MIDRNNIPNVVIQRLPRYYRYLDAMRERGIEYVSSGELAAKLECNPSQIRQDIRLFGHFGITGRGYPVNELCNQLKDILGMSKVHHTIIIGMGYLAHAFLHNFHYAKSSFLLDAAFDTSEKRIGSVLMGVPVYSLDTMEDYIRTHQVDAVFLMLPRHAAQDIVDRLVPLGVRGFWNFSNLELTANRDDVYIENVQFTDSMLILGYHLAGLE